MEEWPGQHSGRPQPPEATPRTTGRGHRHNQSQVRREEKEIVTQKEKVRKLSEEKETLQKEKQAALDRLAELEVHCQASQARAMQLIAEAAQHTRAMQMAKAERDELRNMYDGARKEADNKGREMEVYKKKCQERTGEMESYKKKYEEQHVAVRVWERN